MTGFTVTFDGAIVPGAQAVVAFTVDTSADQGPEELDHPNEVGVRGTSGALSATDTAADTLTSIKDRLAVDVKKKVTPASIPSAPGQIATVQLTGTVKRFPLSTTDAHQIIVQDPADLNSDEWYDAFRPNSVTATPVPADSTLTVQYWDGTTWIDVPGMTDIAGPTIFNGEFPDEVKDDAQGIRFVYESEEGFPPGTSVAPNLTYSLRTAMAFSDDVITDCAGSAATNGDVTAPRPDPACDTITLIPPDPGSVDSLDKAWDRDLLNARSQTQVGATISWSTQGYTGLESGFISDSANPPGTALPSSVYDVFDLVRIDPITPADDPHLTYDQMSKVELFRLAPAAPTRAPAPGWTRRTTRVRAPVTARSRG